MTTAADGDDYTWQILPAGAVLKPLPGEAFAELRAKFGDEFDRIWPDGVQIDLRTPEQKMKALAAEVERLRDLVQLTTAPVDVALRVDELEQQVTGLRRDLATLRLTLERTFEIRL